MPVNEFKSAAAFTFDIFGHLSLTLFANSSGPRYLTSRYRASILFLHLRVVSFVRPFLARLHHPHCIRNPRNSESFFSFADDTAQKLRMNLPVRKSFSTARLCSFESLYSGIFISLEPPPPKLLLQQFKYAIGFCEPVGRDRLTDLPML